MQSKNPIADYGGARGSNAGDQFHELWALQQILALLKPKSQLTAVSVEGIGLDTPATAPDAPAWDGVDCALFFGGRDLTTADRVEFAQLKYSGSNPTSPWTVARLCHSTRTTGNNSVFRRLADDYVAARERLKPGATFSVKLVSNQPAGSDLLEVIVQRSTVPASGADAARVVANRRKVVEATGLGDNEVEDFLGALDLTECGTDSRFEIGEKVVQATIEMLGDDVGGEIAQLQAQVRNLMGPERAGEFVDERKLLVWFGIGDRAALFPCPQQIDVPPQSIERAGTREVLGKLREGARTVLVHGHGGCGKTTLTQQLGPRLPSGSIVVTYDCYGAGSYLYSDDKRHLPERAFLELINDVAVASNLPILVPRSTKNPVTIESFTRRLRLAGEALASVSPDATLLVIVDAADNSVAAAGLSTPPEPCFVKEIATANLDALPANVRFVVSARTARKAFLGFPTGSLEVECLPFTETETRLHLLSVFPNASNAEITSFHDLTRGIPRVQAYALKASGGNSDILFETLLPNGKSLPEVIEASFELALRKLGAPQLLNEITAALAFLPTPAALSAVATVANTSEAIVQDFVADLAPGLRLASNEITIADEDFEDHIKDRSAPLKDATLASIAEHFWASYRTVAYSAAYVVDYLEQAQRPSDAFQVIDRDTSVQAVRDPIQKREIQIRRLTLALASCRESGDVVNALQTILIGAEAQRDEGAFYAVIEGQLDLAVEFSGPSILRRTLLDRDRVAIHGSVMAHCALAASLQNDRAGTLHYLRMYDAWLSKRPRNKQEEGAVRETWKIDDQDIAARVEAIFNFAGPGAALNELSRWIPKEVRLRVLFIAIPRLLARGKGPDLLAFLQTQPPSLWNLAAAVPLAQAGLEVPGAVFEQSLAKLRSSFIPSRDLGASYASPPWQSEWVRILITACEIGHHKQIDPQVLRPAVGKLTVAITQGGHRELFASDASRVDGLMRVWLLARTIEGADRSKKAFFELVASFAKPKEEPKLPPPRGKGKRKAKDKPRSTADENRERLERKLSVLFPVYEHRISLIEKSMSHAVFDADLKALAVGGNSYELDGDYEATYLRGVLARSVADLLFLPTVPVAKLCAEALNTATKKMSPFLGRQSSLLGTFRLRQGYHSDLLDLVAKSAAATKQLSTRASDKVDELIALARFVLPISRPDSEALFNDALIIAKEIDEEAIDQLAFVSTTAKAANAAAPGGERAMAGQLATFAAAAATRLDGHEGFDWEVVLSGIVSLDLPTALACASRWMDDGTVSLGQTLPALLTEGLSTNQIRTELALALSLLTNGPSSRLLKELCSNIKLADPPRRVLLLDELARLMLLDDGQGGRSDEAKAVLAIVTDEQHGPWLDQLRDLVTFIERHSSKAAQDVEAEIEPVNVGVSASAKIESEAIILSTPSREGIEAILRKAAEADDYFHPTGLLKSLGDGLASPADRVPFLEALVSLDADLVGPTRWAPVLADRLAVWGSTPAVQAWCRQRLPSVISESLAELASYLRYHEKYLDVLLEKTQANVEGRVAIMLEGIAASGTRMGSGTLYMLATRVASGLSAPELKRILQWYLERLNQRLPAEDVAKAMPTDVPLQTPEALSRFLFALMTDIDTRVRWRAAHAVRTLVRLNEHAVASSIFNQFDRQADAAFRDPAAPFYQLAGQLWLCIIAYRLSAEQPGILSDNQAQLLTAATNQKVPHVAIREYAKRALQTAHKAGVLSLTSDELGSVSAANRPKRRAGKNTQKNPHRSHSWDRNRPSKRFSFDEMDTIPYWYSNLLSIFPTVKQDRILAMAERWIIDVWKAPLDVNKWVKEARRETRLSERGYALWSHDHGSFPTAERHSTYLEWHAMLCVAGELLETAPVGAPEYGEDRFDSWMERFLPSEPPMWTSDLRGPTPLADYLWWPDERTDRGWVNNVRMGEFDTAIGLHDSVKPGWIVVASRLTSHHPTREENSHVTSALVSPDTAAALVRALQTASTRWDFRIPDENDDLAIDHGPFRLVGWLNSPSSDVRFDEHDPFRFDIGTTRSVPGKVVTKALRLSRQTDDGSIWSAKGATQPAFIYQAWSDEPSRERDMARTTKSDGWRLLMRQDDLATFLTETGLDLVFEISIDRRLRSQYSSSYDQDATEKKNFKILALTRDGAIIDSEGNARTWKKASRRIRP